jgi:hypothetical protein
MSKKSTVVIAKTIGSARLGEWINPQSGFTTTTGHIAPFCKGPESTEAMLRNVQMLNPDQPIEYSGFGMDAIIRKAISVQTEIYYRDSSDPFTELASHPGIVSYPPEVIWLANAQGLNAFKKSLVENLPKIRGTGYSKDDAVAIADRICLMAKNGAGSLSFWEHLTDEFNGESYGSILVNFQAYTASRLKCRGLAGLVPLIDERHPKSIEMTYQFNEATATELENLRNEGAPAPEFYFFTLNMNSSMFKNSNMSDELNKTIEMVNFALRNNKELFDGLHVSIRGLDRISDDPGRIDVVYKFIARLREICTAVLIPFWFSKSGISGLSFLDKGVDYCSSSLNMSLGDVYVGGGGAVNSENIYGKVYHPTLQKRFTVKEVVRTIEKRGTMPEIRGVNFLLRDADLVSSQRYRVNFGKPYNLAVICDLSDKWRNLVVTGEEESGRIYLSRCPEPIFRSWGKW